jgi:hypothetical protein
MKADGRFVVLQIVSKRCQIDRYACASLVAPRQVVYRLLQQPPKINSRLLVFGCSALLKLNAYAGRRDAARITRAGARLFVSRCEKV